MREEVIEHGARAHYTATTDMDETAGAPVPDQRDELKKRIEQYYIPTQLVQSILEIGDFPTGIVVEEVGIGFLDIADYSMLSRFLAPRENQDVLNGLYTAFHQVLIEHGGYLNKIEGDSIMFHFGGNIDTKLRDILRDMGEEEARNYVARELFNTCVELQRKCALFNEANNKFISAGSTAESRKVLQKAFDIISMMRHDEALSEVFGALYQIRVRIGASIGPVTMGNFGPEGAKQWDVIGDPVIEAKRMESTAPIGGLRISKRLYDILDGAGKVDEYFNRFKREATVLGSRYAEIEKDDLFRASSVLLKDKGNATFDTYKVQVSAQLPTAIATQVELLLKKGPTNSPEIMRLLEYYRGNKYVICAVEDSLKKLGVDLRKGFILETMYPTRFKKIQEQFNGDTKKVEEYIDKEHTLFDLLDRLGRFQDLVKQRDPPSGPPDFTTYDAFMAERLRQIRDDFDNAKNRMVQRAYFYNVVYPLVLESVETSIRERQYSMEEVAELDEA